MDTTNKPIIALKQVTKAFGGQKIIDKLSLDIERGKINVLLGPSGVGKTSLFRLITDLSPVDGGSIYIDGLPLVQEGEYVSKKARRSIRKKLGLVFQNFQLFPHLSVIENIIEAPLKVLKIPREEAVLEARRLLQFLNLEGAEGKYPYQLSGGQLQRVAIARALAMKPEIICFDEPTSALDPGLRKEVGDLMKRIAKEGMTLFIVTHDIFFAKEVADQVMLMEQGHIQLVEKEVDLLALSY